MRHCCLASQPPRINGVKFKAAGVQKNCGNNLIIAPRVNGLIYGF